MISWSLKKLQVKSLKKHPSNPRKLTREQYDQLKTSIDLFGLIDKPIVNLDMQIIGGHQRVKVLKKDKVKEVECWMPDNQLSEHEVKELMIRLNRGGSFDYDKLANEFEVPDLLDWGFSIEELELKSLDDIDSEEEEPKKKEKRCPHCDGIL